MEKKDVEALLNTEDLGPIEDYLLELAASGASAAFALGMCTMRIEEAAPALRAVLAKAANGSLADGEGEFFFAAVHVLGAGRDQASFRPLLRFLRRQSDVEFLLGDADTETLSKIVAGVFDGDSDSLFAAIGDAEIDSAVRGAVLGAAAFLTWDGRIGRDLMRGFLQRIDQRRLDQDDDFIWFSWQEAISLLGFRELSPLVDQAFRDGRLPPDLLKPKDFATDLEAAERSPTDASRFHRSNLGYIDDIVEAVSWVNTEDDDDMGTSEPWKMEDETALPKPMSNPFRDVGRNDPCPCGSGKKAKKCCLASA